MLPRASGTSSTGCSIPFLQDCLPDSPGPCKGEAARARPARLIAGAQRLVRVIRDSA